MKILLSILFFLISVSSILGQTIENLEYDLSWFYASEKYGDRIDKARQLQKIDPLNEVAADYICRYYYDREIDSVSIFLDNLTSTYPNRTEMYMLRFKLIGFENRNLTFSEQTFRKVNHLQKALQLDSTNKTVLYNLAKTFYNDFLYPIEKKKHYESVYDFDLSAFGINSNDTSRKIEVKISAFEHSADSALKYYYYLWLFDVDQRDVIFFPIRQLECYLNKQTTSLISENLPHTINNCYFPTWYFANLSENWEKDYFNYLYELESSKETAEWFSMQLSDLKEPCLYNQNIVGDFESFRFLWLRTFSNPISIRIEKKQNNISLYWKVGKGAGGYAPKGIRKQGKRILKQSDWNEFINLISLTNFDSLPNEHLFFPVCDGASWTIERKLSASFKAHHTINPNKEFRECCLFLLKRSNIKVKKDDIY